MFTINIKRSAAALAVTAGLFAAAAPASHAYSFGVSFDGSVKAPVSSDSRGTTYPTHPSGLSIATAEVFELNTFGSLDPVEHRGGNDTQRAAGGAHGLKPDSNEVAVEGLKADSNEVAVEGITLSHEGGIWRNVVADAGAGDDKITQAREPAPVTMLDYMGSPVVTH